jgi:beta-lactamase superfamily II metal-dependent hydrolase
MTRIIFYHVGKGDLSLVLLPDGRAMLIDCYKADGAANAELTNTDVTLDKIGKEIVRHKLVIGEANLTTKAALYDEALRERDGKKKTRVHVLAVSHADRDHILSMEKLQQHFDIDLLMDNGREYAAPSEVQKDYVKFRAAMEKAGKYDPIRRARSNLLPGSGVSLDAICPNRDIAPEEDNNNQCLVLRLEYAGRRFLFTGDTQVDDWINPKYGIMILHPGKLAADILKVSHHGSRTFFTPPASGPESPKYEKKDYDVKALKAINPSISLITCSDDEDAEHPHPIALELYREHTNTSLPSHARPSHVILTRESRHVHFVIDSDGTLYKRTSRSKCNEMETDENGNTVFLKGMVQSPCGYLDASGIWVVTLSPNSETKVSFSVERKGKWEGEVQFDWWVFNNGQGSDAAHNEYYSTDSKDGKKQSTWSRSLMYRGVHLMQCHASTGENKQWANWCVLVCYKDYLPLAKRWLELFPKCINPKRINK